MVKILDEENIFNYLTLNPVFNTDISLQMVLESRVNIAMQIANNGKPQFKLQNTILLKVCNIIKSKYHKCEVELIGDDLWADFND